jgi:hypothetical protein
VPDRPRAQIRRSSCRRRCTRRRRRGRRRPTGTGSGRSSRGTVHPPRCRPCHSLPLSPSRRAAPAGSVARPTESANSISAGRLSLVSMTASERGERQGMVIMLSSATTPMLTSKLCALAAERRHRPLGGDPARPADDPHGLEGLEELHECIGSSAALQFRIGRIEPSQRSKSVVESIAVSLR